MRLKSLARRLGVRAIAGLPRRTLEKLVPREAIALFYHSIAEKPLPHVRHLYPHKSPSEFEADVIYLKQNYRLPAFSEFAEEMTSPHGPKQPCAILTFDDGMSQCFDLVRPILLKHRVPCSFFITKCFIDNRELFYRHKVSLCIDAISGQSTEEQARCARSVGKRIGLELSSAGDLRKWIKGLRLADESMIDVAGQELGIDFEAFLKTVKPYMTSDQVKELHTDGFTIGAHSLRHARFAELTNPEIESDIVESCSFVGSLLGLKKVPFAFPFSAQGVDRRFLRSVAQRHPWVTPMFGTDGLNIDDPYLVNRLPADTPAGVPPGRSGIKEYVARAYANQILGNGYRSKEVVVHS
jgi:peptidoglycan/xylan/chitin deacetylase (PgdA/CDA1 family)